MHKAIRTQSDDLSDEYSANTAIEFDQTVDMARQEFAAEADINTMMKKFMPLQNTRVSEWGQEIDYDMDLQTALAAIDAAKRAHAQMTPELRAKYPTWQALLNGLNSGQFKIDLNEKPEPEIIPEPAPLAHIPTT